MEHQRLRHFYSEPQHNDHLGICDRINDSTFLTKPACPLSPRAAFSLLPREHLEPEALSLHWVTVLVAELPVPASLAARVPHPPKKSASSLRV